MSVRDFNICVQDEVLDDLFCRLENTRWPTMIDGAGWEYGINFSYLKDLCEYWRTEYDWRKWEARLNSFPHFLCEVDGVDIHFWHVKGKGEKCFPLLLLHGWPGSAYEFFDTIELLTEKFDVVIPELPGFGWSGKPRVPGWGADRIARAMDTLMVRELEYSHYGVQGGDWGAMVAARLGADFPDHVTAMHLNYTMIPGPMLDELSPEDMEVCKRLDEFDFWEGAYHLIQETKCDMLTVAQTDSPAGLAAWIVEKFYSWSDCNGDLESVFAKDQLLTNLMFYWVSNSVASAARIYYESFHNPELNWGWPNPQIPVPTAVARFPKDPFHRPKGWMEKHYQLARWNEMPRGGHFPAMEAPELLAEDMMSFFENYK